MLPTVTLLFMGIVAPSAAPSVRPGDWTQFRGPDRTGYSHEKGLLTEWPEGGPNRVWVATDLGGGYGSVSVVGGMIFGTGKSGDKEVVWALDEKSGKKLWETPFADIQRVGYGEGPRSTPTFANGKLYAVAINGELACLNANDGKILWSKNYVRDYGGKVQSWGYSESVLVDDGKVIGTPCSNTAAMVAWNADDGKEIWVAKVDKAGQSGGYSSPIKAVVGEVPMYITLLGDAGGVVAVHAKTGDVLWQYKEMMNGVANIPSPVVLGDKLFCSTGYGAGAALLQLIPDGQKVTYKRLRFYKGGEIQNYHGGITIVGNYLYLGSQHNQGFPACIDIQNGNIPWKMERGAGDGKGSAATAAYGDRVIFRYQNGVVALIKADPKDFELVSSFKIPEPSGKASWPHPAIAQGKLYLRDQEKLHCFDLSTK